MHRYFAYKPMDLGGFIVMPFFYIDDYRHQYPGINYIHPPKSMGVECTRGITHNLDFAIPIKLSKESMDKVDSLVGSFNIEIK